MIQRKPPRTPSGGTDERPGTLLVRAVATITFDEARVCETARAALLPESEGFLQIETQGKRLHLLVPQGSPNRVLSTLDDAIACLQAAESSRKASRKKDDR